MSSKTIIPIVVIILALLVGVGVYSTFTNLNPLNNVSTSSVAGPSSKSQIAVRQQVSSQVVVASPLQITATSNQLQASSIVSVPAAVSQVSITKPFSKTELATYNSESSCYVSVLQKVYDVTAYLDKHPGGRDMLKGCGKVLDGMRHPGGAYTGDKIQGILQDYYVGELK